MADPWIAPNRLDVVQRVNAERPGLIRNAHAFTAAVACELRATDAKWGRNGKRGNANDLSDDVVAWRNPAVPWGCSIVDIIGGAGGPNPSPAWIDQTHATADGGTVGAWVAPDCAAVPDPGPGPDPAPPVVTPPTTPPYDDTAIKGALLSLHGKVDAVLAKLDAAASQQAADTDQIGKWMVEQAQGVVNAVVGDLTPKIEKDRCRFRWSLRGGAPDVAGLPGDSED